MTPTRALWIVAILGVAVFALSFANGWIVHDREIRGEGYRHSQIALSAWRSAAIPVLSAGVVAALAAGLGAAARIAGVRAVPAWLPLGAAVVALALLGTSLAPLSWDGHTTSIDLTPGVLTWVGIALAAAMVGFAAMTSHVPLRAGAVLAVVAVAVVAAGVAGRSVVLTASGPSNQNWSDGTYVLVDGAEPGAELVIADGTYRLADRWAGAWEGSGGWTVALDDDPACAGSRGAYHAHGEGPEGTDLRFVKIVDTCEEGARAELLESGTWERRP